MTDSRAYDPTTVPVRPAATVMLVRDVSGVAAVGGEPTIEVFMLRRTLGAVFGSGMYVFPGGRVETSDGVDVEQAHRLAAIRECFEEAGVLLARDASGTPVTNGHPVLAARAGVYDGSVDILELCDEHGLHPDLDHMVWVSHWITPVGEQRRFDTRFYLVPAPRGQSSSHDDNETIASLWVEPADALRRQAAGELTMMPPTVTNLRFLAEHASVDAVMGAARLMPPPECVLPKLRTDADGKLVGILLPGDPGYADA